MNKHFQEALKIISLLRDILTVTSKDSLPHEKFILITFNTVIRIKQAKYPDRLLSYSGKICTLNFKCQSLL